MISYFTFDFYNDDIEEMTTYQLVLTGNDSVYIGFYRNIDGFCKQISNMEAMGIHDTSLHAGDLHGFTSYEIHVDDYDRCMIEWAQWLRKIGFIVSSPYIVDSSRSIGEFEQQHLIDITNRIAEFAKTND